MFSGCSSFTPRLSYSIFTQARLCRRWTITVFTYMLTMIFESLTSFSNRLTKYLFYVLHSYTPALRWISVSWRWLIYWGVGGGEDDDEEEGEVKEERRRDKCNITCQWVLDAKKSKVSSVLSWCERKHPSLRLRATKRWLGKLHYALVLSFPIFTRNTWTILSIFSYYFNNVMSSYISLNVLLHTTWFAEFVKLIVSSVVWHSIIIIIIRENKIIIVVASYFR